MTSIILLIYASAVAQHFDPRLALSVAFVESSFNPLAEGTTGDIGLFQVRHELVGLTKEEMLDVDRNIDYGIKLLRLARNGCSGMDEITSVVCYNRGIGGGKRVVFPSTDSYVLKVSRVYDCLSQYSYLDLVKGKEKGCFR